MNEQHQFVKPKLFHGPPTDVMPENSFSFLKKSRSTISFLSKKGDAQVFNYTYTVQSGKNSQTYHYLCFLYKAQKKLPEVEIRSENFFDKLIKPIYSKDIPIPADSEWSKRFLVKGKNEVAVQNFITPSFIERFQSPKYSFFTSGNQFLLTYNKTQSHNVDEQLKMIDDGVAISKITRR